jgi:hypothetical protein
MKTIKEILISKIGFLMLLAHWILCTLAIYQRSGLSYTFHFVYEPFLFQLIVILDLLWITLAETLTGSSNGFYGNPLPVFIAGFLLAGIQWYLIGYFIGKIRTIKLK